MKLWQLQALLPLFENFKRIMSIKRVLDNTLLIRFEEKQFIFDMQRGASLIYPQRDAISSAKLYNSPFDIQLSKLCSGSFITKVELFNGDKILHFTLEKRGSYKVSQLHLFFEFTGKYTNVVITNESLEIVEALRHVDSRVSVRQIKPTLRYTSPPKASFIPKIESCDDIEIYLYEKHLAQKTVTLQQAQTKEILKIEKKIKKLEQELLKLESEESLRAKADILNKEATLLLSHIHHIKGYQKEVTLEDFDGTKHHILLSGNAPVNVMIDQKFKIAKRLKNRAKNVSIEKKSLQEKCDFAYRFINVIRSTQTKNELMQLFPKLPKKSKKEQSNHIETFIIEGHYLYLGKNERGNIELLHNAKASDIWMHLQERVSGHLLIPTQKKSLPQSLLEQAAHLCAAFSLPKGERTMVDYTPRRNVKIKHGANVEYVNYKSIHTTA
jgi:predicted ribosome quality control (RQC) complex YloA/Tae2 family protein